MYECYNMSGDLQIWQLNVNLWLRYWIKLWKTYLYLLVEENNDYDENNDFYENND